MMYVTAKTKDYVWHVGNAFEPGFDAKDVVELQADGHELDLIERMFSNTIPMTTRPVVIWHGDLARTIFCNVRNHPQYAYE